jgi:hypothetical protein
MVRCCGRLGEPYGNPSRLAPLNLTDAIVRFSQQPPRRPSPGAGMVTILNCTTARLK